MARKHLVLRHSKGENVMQTKALVTAQLVTEYGLSCKLLCLSTDGLSIEVFHLRFNVGGLCRLCVVAFKSPNTCTIKGYVIHWCASSTLAIYHPSLSFSLLTPFDIQTDPV
ncbi:hypothetical protein ILYODFUR_014093 [Ilyodon furcidens]|uniref:Uncharacterized protein n=1 Tax=Ilyodon furcidens TaxID=33524 RepID=A0ABV0US46_9TELE